MTTLHALVEDLQDYLKRSKNNLQAIKNALIPFARQPLFERKDGRKDTCLNIESRQEKISRKYGEIEKEAQNILQLLDENMRIFKMENDSENPKWQNYIDYVDNIVFSYLYQSVGCR